MGLRSLTDADAIDIAYRAENAALQLSFEGDRREAATKHVLLACAGAMRGIAEDEDNELRLAPRGGDLDHRRRTLAAAAEPLTPHMARILQYLADGRDRQQICEAMGLALGTIRATLATIRRKLRAETTAEAVAVAMRNGWIK